MVSPTLAPGFVSWLFPRCGCRDAGAASGDGPRELMSSGLFYRDVVVWLLLLWRRKVKKSSNEFKVTHIYSNMSSRYTFKI